MKNVGTICFGGVFFSLSFYLNVLFYANKSNKIITKLNRFEFGCQINLHFSFYYVGGYFKFPTNIKGSSFT